MALVNRSFSVNVTPGEMPPIVHVSEYDVGRAYTVSILDEQGNTFTIPTGTTASIEGTLNGTVGFTQTATVSNNQVSFTLSESMTAYSGKAWCKIKLTQNSQPIQTCAFILAVDRAGVEADTVIGAPGFEEQIADAAAEWMEQQGFTSPTVTITPITGGNRVTFTDAEHPSGQSIDVMNGEDGGGSSGGGGGSSPVTSVNGMVGDVVLNAASVGALPSTYAAPVTSVNGKTGAVVLKTSDLQNDSGYITSAPVSSVNGKTGAVVLDAEDVGALPDDTFIPSKTSELVNDAHFVTEAEAGVSSVNGQTGVVLLTTSDISNTSGYITANDIPQEVPTADASANGMVLGVENGRYTFVRMTGGISDVYMGGESIIQSGTTIAVIPYATTSSQGVVQLYDGTDSTSKSLVPTADALRGVAQRVGNLETRSANWLTETQIKVLIDSMVQEQIAMYQRRVFALEDNKEDIDITSLSDLTSSEILHGDHWKQVGTNYNFGAVLYNPESKTIGGSSSDLIYLKRGYIIGVSKNSWFVTSDQNWYCSHVFLSYPKMQAVYAYDEENNIRYIAADIPAEIVEQAKVLAEDFLSQIESLETEI